MANTVIRVENISKLYRLGEVGTGTISHDINRWWARMQGKEDPFSKVGMINDRTKAAEKNEHVWAIKDINFDVKQGEVLGIIGKNGAGKSTLLKILSRITSPTTGNIKLKGRVASLLEVGTGFHPEMTGRENVYLNGTILGMTRREIDTKFDEIMDFAGCLRYADTPVKRYSSGMKVRLGFAVAAFLEPEILIVDEVLAVGDAEFQKKAIGKMQDITSGGGRTVLFVSHNMNSVNAICSKCVVLKDGKISFIDKTESAIDFYLQEYLSGGIAGDKQFTYDQQLSINFMEAFLEDGSGVRINNLISGSQDIKINLIVEYAEDYNNIDVVYFINNARGETVISLDRVDYHKELLSVKKGKYRLTVALPNPLLVDGIYYVSFAMVDRKNTHITKVEKDAISFEIKNVDTIRTKPRKGYAYIVNEWRLQQL